MAQEAQSIPRHSVIIQTYNNNDLRVTVNNDEAMKNISHWYTQTTKELVKPCKKQKYTKAIILDCARKDRVFNESDWQGIVIDYMLSLGYELIGDGNSTKLTQAEYGRQQINHIFITTSSSTKIYITIN